MPSQPPDPYERNFNFTEFSQIFPLKQQPGQQIDIELNDVQITVNNTISRLNEIQNDDGSLRLPGSLPWYQQYLAGVSAAVSSAENAAESASVASASAQAAGDHELNAYTSSQAAAVSENAAADSAQESGVSAAAASASADAAAQSAVDADASAQAAAASAASINPATYIPQPVVAPVADQILGYDGTAWVAQDNFATVLQESVRNETGSPLAKGSVVYINGAAGNKPLAALAQANAESTSSKTLGVIAASIANNKNGNIVTSGLLKGLDTLAYAPGTALWLSPSQAGGYTSTKPTAPNHAVLVGFVVRQHQTQGEVLVRIANGYELDELHDVQISDPSTGQFLVRNGDVWQNQTVGVVRYDQSQSIDGMAQSVARSNIGLGSAATSSTSDFAPTLHTHPVADITDFPEQVAYKLGIMGGANGGVAVGGTPGTDKVIGFDGLYGSWVDRNPFDQSLNTNNGVTFGSISMANIAINPTSGFEYYDGQNLAVANYQGFYTQDFYSSGQGMSMTPYGLTFPDGTTQSTAGGGGTSYDQSLNTFNSVAFNGIVSTAPVTVKDLNGIQFYDTANDYSVGALSATTAGLTIYSSSIPGAGWGQLGYQLIPDQGLSFTDVDGNAWFGLTSAGVRFPDGSTQTSAGPTIADMVNYAPNASPSFSGTPTAPTATPGTNTTQIATTAFVKNAVDNAVVTVPDATTTVKGIVELATSAEALGGTSETLAVTPKGLRDGLDSVVFAGGTGGVDVQIFGGPSSSGTFTWNKPLGAKMVTIKMVGAGGGGGSGASAATSISRSGGGGGGAGASSTFMELADGLPNQVTVLVGAGGNGGAASSGAGLAGSNGGATTFGPFSVRHGVASGSHNGAGTSGTGAVFIQVGVISGPAAAGATTAGNTPANITTGYLLPTGGGGGAGAGAGSTTNQNGGSAGSRSIATTSPFANTTALAGGAGGTSAGIQATNGTNQDTKFAGGTGGGGGYYRTGEVGGTGGNGGWPGGGGGGGGASDSGFLSGAGGSGANGMVIVITNF